MLSRRRRRWIAAAVIAAVLAALWVVVGQPWLPPVVAVAAAVLTRLLTRVRAYQPARATMTGLLVGGLVLLIGQSLWAWLLIGGTTTAVTVGPAAPRPLLPAAHAANAAHATSTSPATLRRSVLHWRLHLALLGALTAALGLVGLVQQHAATERQRAAQEQHASALARARLLPPSPPQAAHALLDAIADNDPSACNTLLDTTGAAQLATNTHTTDCPAAIHALSSRVVDRNRYPQPDSSTIPTTTLGDTATVDTCHMTWLGLSGILGTAPTPAVGPQTGQLRLTRVLGQGWTITDIHKC